MAELAQFADEQFDPKEWINTAAAHRPPDEPLERHLAELEMKLQLAAEDVDAALQDYSLQALQRIPATVHEIRRMKGDVASLKGEVSTIVSRLADAQRSAMASVGVLQEVDVVRSRMETAATTLQEATGLSDLLGKVEQVFESGDVSAMSATLAHMRRSLALVGEVPGFQGGQAKLEELEDRLQRLVEGPLAAAFVQQKGDKAQQLAGMLTSIQRGEVVERLYMDARLAPLQSCWDAFGPHTQGGFSAWLPGFYDEVLRVIEHESWWCSDVLPEHHPQLVLALLEKLLGQLAPDFAHRLAGVIEERSPAPMAALLTVQGAMVRFGGNLRQALHAAGATRLTPTMAAVYGPIEALLPRYPSLEGGQLAQEIDSLGLGTVAADDTEAAVAVLRASVPKCFALLDAALERCMKFTGGSSLPALLDVLDRSCVRFVGQAQGLVAKLSARVLSRVPGGRVADGEESFDESGEEVNAVLPVLSVAINLVTRLAVFDAALRSRVGELGPAIRGLLPLENDPSNPLVLRLARQEELRRQLLLLSEQSAAPRFTALRQALAAGSTFEDAAKQFVYEALMVKVKVYLLPVPQMPEWAADPEGESGSGGGVRLPTFSVYPAGYVTAVGEYLMMLPQLLESLEGGEGDSAPQAEEEEEQAIEGEWLDKVAVGSAELYADQLEAVPQLSAQGSAQLAADLEYFCNVLSALSVDLPPRLATWQVALTFPDEDFSGSATAAIEDAGDGGLDQRVMQLVARVKGLHM